MYFNVAALTGRDLPFSLTFPRVLPWAMCSCPFRARAALFTSISAPQTKKYVRMLRWKFIVPT